MNNNQPLQTQSTLGAQVGQTPQVQPVRQNSMNQANLAPKKKTNSGAARIIVIVILVLTTVVFAGLFLWMLTEFNTLKADYDKEVAAEIAKAKDEQSIDDAYKCQEEKDFPYKIFAGPVDYGELNFEYPKTWSAYIAKDASNGGDFEAYLNPIQVEPISNSTVNALRIRIVNRTFEDVAKEYQRYVGNRDSVLNVESVTVNGATANLYYGTIPNTDLSGYILIFKIRDKTAFMQTDSVLFKESFEKIIQSIKFNS